MSPPVPHLDGLSGVLRQLATDPHSGVPLALEHAEHSAQSGVEVVGLLVVGAHDGEPRSVAAGTSAKLAGPRPASALSWW